MATRSTIRRIAGFVLAAVSIATAFHSAKFAYFSYLRHVAPEAASRLDPQDGLALTARISLELQKAPERTFGSSDFMAARSSLIARPLNEGALRIIASYYEAKRDQGATDRAMLLSNRISRRDMLVQLWLIERSVSRDDIEGAIRHYHAALSVHPELKDVLFPVLEKALIHREVRNALRPYILSQAPWMPAFIATLAVQGNILDTEKFVSPVAGRLVGDNYRAAAAGIIHRLAVAHRTDAALAMSARIAPDVTRQERMSFKPTPATTDTRFGRLSWTFPQEPGVDSSAGEDGSLVVQLTPPFSGEIAVRDVIVRPGSRSHLSQKSEFGSDGGSVAARWSVTCADAASAPPGWNLKFPILPGAKLQRYEIDIPADCSVLRFAIQGFASDSQTTDTLRIYDMDFK